MTGPEIPLGDQRLPPRFWKRVAERGSCWVWIGSRVRRKWDYGQIRVHGRTVGTHRFAWMTICGPIPLGVLVLHQCDNPPCVRPSHLYLGKQSRNLRDMVARGRRDYSAQGAGFVGEANPAAKLTMAQVAEIRLRYQRYGRKNNTVTLSREFGVSPNMVGYIVRYANWRVCS